MSFTCQYCGKSFQRKYNLDVHQKRTKYCIEKQNKTQPTLSVTTNTTNTTDTQLMLLQLIKQLQQTIDKLSDRPVPPAVSSNNNTRNVVLNNLQPLTEQDLQDHLDHLTLNFIQDGAKGYADYAGNYPFKNRLMCTDKSRKKLKYKDINGEIVDDGGGIKITQRFFQAIAPRNEEIINAEYKSLHEEVQQIAKDGTAGSSNLIELLTKATKLQQLLISCKEAARGEDNDLTKEFIHYLTKML